MKTPLLVVFLVGCAFAQNPDFVPNAKPACGPVSAGFRIKTNDAPRPDAQIAAGKALIYVVEDQKFKAFRDVTARIGMDGAWVGAMRGNSYVSFTVEPGEHHFCADWVSDWITGGRLVSLYGLNAEAGKVYYFRVRTSGTPGSLTEEHHQGDIASLDLDLVNEDEGKLLVASSASSNFQAKK